MKSRFAIGAMIAIGVLAIVLRLNERAEKSRADLRDSKIERSLALAPQGGREAVRLALQGLSRPPTAKEKRALTMATQAARRFAEELVIETDAEVRDAAWSEDGKRLALVGDDLRLVDAADGKALVKERLPAKGLFVRWSDHRLTIVMSDRIEVRADDGTTKLDQRAVGSTPTRASEAGEHFASGSRITSSFVTSPDDARLYATHASGIDVLDARSGASLAQLRPRSWSIAPSAWPLVSRDGKRLAIEREDHTTDLRDLETGAQIDQLPGRPLGLSPDGKRIVTAAEHEAVAWRIGGTGLVQRVPEPDQPLPPRWILDGSRPVALEDAPPKLVRPVVFERVVMGESEGTLLLWDRATGKLTRLVAFHDVPVRIARDAPCAVGCTRDGCESVDASGVRRPLAAPRGRPIDLALSNDGRRAGLRIEADGVTRWVIGDVATGRLETMLPDAARLVFTSKRVLCADPARTVLHRLTGEEVLAIDGELGAVSPDEGLFQTHAGARATVRDAESGERRLDYEARAGSGRFSPRGGQWLVLGEPEAILFDTFTGARLVRMPHVKEIAAWSDSGAWIASTDGDGKLQLWSGGGNVVELPPSGALLFSRDGRYVFADSPPRLVDLSWETIHAAACRIAPDACP